jgi:hypothetical protein
MKIYARPSHQLGNSLRNTLTMKIFADYIGAEFYMDGICVNNLDHLKDKIIMTDLFKKYIVYDINPSTYTVINETDLFNFKSWGTTSDVVVEGTFKNIPTYDFGLYHIYAMKHNDMTDEVYCKNKIQCYKELEWPTFLLDEVEIFNNINKLETLTSVHIRYTDNLADSNKHNTTLDTFIEKIKTIENNILLCSDNQDVINKIVNITPNIILPNKISNPLYQSLY